MTKDNELDLSIPKLHKPSVWHIGSLDEAQSDPSSYEGGLLSVSTCPASWQRIAKLSGDLWRIESPNMHFVDAHAFRENTALYHLMLGWGSFNGFLELKTVYHVDVFDDELESSITWTFETLEELEREFEEEDVEIRPDFLAPVLTDYGLQRYGLKRNGSQYNMDYVLIDYVERVLVHEDPCLFGVWWEDKMDPLTLSAPRAGISTYLFDRVKFSKEDRSPQEIEDEYHSDFSEECDGLAPGF